MTTRLPLPPIPDLTALTLGRPVLDQVLTDLANRPTNRVAYYDDSPYVTPTAHTPDDEPEPDDEDDGSWCNTRRSSAP